MTRFAALLFVIAVSACEAPKPACLLVSQHPMSVVELFFGRDIPGRQPLTDGEWSEFAVSVIAKEFPEGFTVSDGEGEWRDPETQAVTQERTKILTAVTAKSVDLAARITRIRDTYSRLYRQISVGILTYDACAEF